MQSASNSEMIAQAYIKWGQNLTVHVLGQFCGLIYDYINNTVFMFQDSFGLKTIYFSIESLRNKTHFSTELEHIENSISRKEIDLEYIANYLEHGGAFTERTPFLNVNRLVYGRCLQIRSNTIQFIQPWIPEFATTKATDDYEVGETFRQTLGDAISVFDTIKGKVWCEVSGGLDSTSLFYLMKNRRDGVLQAFSVLSNNLDDDGDTSTLLSISSDLGTDWVTLDSSKHPRFEFIYDRPAGEPGSEIGGSLTKACSNIISEHKVDYLISGLGGDQVLGNIDCEPFYFADYLGRLKLIKLFQHVHSWKINDSQYRSHMWWLTRYGIKPCLQHLFHQRIGLVDNIQDVTPWLTLQFRNQYALDRRWAELPIPRTLMPGQNSILQDIYLICSAEAVSSSSMVPVHYHHPLLHRPLVEFMIGLDSNQRRQPKFDRILQRRALRGIVPDVILNRYGKGTAQVSFNVGFRKNKEIQAALKKSVLVKMGVFDSNKWGVAIDRFLFGQTESLPHFYASICMELWLQGWYNKNSQWY